MCLPLLQYMTPVSQVPLVNSPGFLWYCGAWEDTWLKCFSFKSLGGTLRKWSYSHTRVELLFPLSFSSLCRPFDPLFINRMWEYCGEPTTGFWSTDFICLLFSPKDRLLSYYGKKRIYSLLVSVLFLTHSINSLSLKWKVNTSDPLSILLK